MSAPTAMEWRACPGFPDYEVSEHGDVRRAVASRTRKRGWRLRGFIDGDGYLRYVLRAPDRSKAPICAHVMVALAFIGPAPSDKHEVAHNNGSRVANHHSNLRWATRKENDADTKVHGTDRSGERNGNAKVSEADVIDIRREYRRIKNRESAVRVGDLARRYGLNHKTLVRIARGAAWTHLPLEAGATA